MKQELLYKEEVYNIVGSCMEVYNELGPGFNEVVYQKCLEYEMTARKIAYEAQKHIDVLYKGESIGKYYTPDFLCYGCIILEIKAEDKLIKVHRAQVLNYLKATGYRVGLLVNFGHEKNLQYERFIV